MWLFLILLTLLFGLELLASVFLFQGLFWLISVRSRCFFNRWHWFLKCPGFSQWWHVGLGLSAFTFVSCRLTVFICSSSGAYNLFGSSSLSKCVTICSYAPFSKWVWCIDFFRCGGILAQMICSTMAWAAIPNASLASFWSSSRKSTKFDLLGWRRVSGICASLLPSIGVLHNSFGKLLEFLPKSLGWGH